MPAQRWSWPGSIVTRVIDGDSFVAKVTRDLGFHGTASFEVKMRIDGINAAKLSSPEGKLARDALILMIMSAPVEITTTGPYKYGDEWMAEIKLASGHDVAAELIAGGHAVPWDGKGARPADS